MVPNGRPGFSAYGHAGIVALTEYDDLPLATTGVGAVGRNRSAAFELDARGGDTGHPAIRVYTPPVIQGADVTRTDEVAKVVQIREHVHSDSFRNGVEKFSRPFLKRWL